MRNASRRLGSIATTVVAAASLVSCATARTHAARVDIAAVESGVKTALARDGRLAGATNVDVNPSTGVVRLSGRVASAEERRAPAGSRPRWMA